MDLIKKYGDVLKNNIDSPEKVLKYLKAGYSLQYIALKFTKDKKLPKSLNYLSELCMKYTLDPLKKPQTAAFVNIFAPTEFLHAFDMNPQLIEAMSSYLAGTKCEDGFIERAESEGIAESLCSYHKTFIGAAMTKVIPKPRFAITTTTACDGNVNTFRLVSEIYGIDTFVIDVPYEYSKEGQDYVAGQLKDLVVFIEEHIGKKLDEEKLKEVIRTENKTIECQRKYLEVLKTKYFPNTITSEMFKVFTTHSGMGRNDNLKFYEMMLKDIEDYPQMKAKRRLIWAHLLPFYSESIREYLDCNQDYQLLLSDMNIDNLEMLDPEDPYGSIARKLINNTYNGPFNRRGSNIVNYAKELNADGVINFCHWGCKESNGGALILKDMLAKEDIQMISIDGDAVDRRNSQEGQNKTRLEAFFEMLDSNEGEN